MFRMIETYEDNTLGLPYPITIINGVEEEVDDVSGEVMGVSILDYEALVATVAATRCVIAVRLSGQEVKFIRRVLEMSARDFATAVSMDPATLSRWENGKQEVGAWADKAARYAAVTLLREYLPVGYKPSDILGIQPVKIHGTLSGIKLERQQLDAEAGPGADDPVVTHPPHFEFHQELEAA